MSKCTLAPERGMAAMLTLREDDCREKTVTAKT